MVLIDYDGNLADQCDAQGKLLQAVDGTDIHGGLLALSEVAAAYKERYSGPDLESRLRDIFSRLALVKPATLTAHRNELITAEACRLIATTLTLHEVELKDRGAVPHWRKVVEGGLCHRSATVQDEAAAAMASLSELVDCEKTVKR